MAGVTLRALEVHHGTILIVNSQGYVMTRIPKRSDSDVCDPRHDARRVGAGHRIVVLLNDRCAARVGQKSCERPKQSTIPI
jgi:hypothetical protein